MIFRRRATAALVVCGAGRIFAAGPPVGLDVLPSLIEISVASGESVERVVTLTNPGSEPVEVSARPADWSMSESGEVRFLDPGTQTSSCAGWISVAPDRVRVPAGGQAIVRLRVSPAAVFSGTRWAAVLFSLPVTDSSFDGQRVSVAPRIGVSIYVTAAGTEREDLRLRSSSATERDGGQGLRLQMRVANEGNTAVRFRATWQLRSADGNFVRAFDVRSSVALPGASREVFLDVRERIPPGTYGVTGMVRWGAKRWSALDSQVVVSGSRSGV